MNIGSAIRPNLEVADNSILIKTTSDSVSINGSSQAVVDGKLLYSIAGVKTLDINGNNINEISKIFNIKPLLIKSYIF